MARADEEPRARGKGPTTMIHFFQPVWSTIAFSLAHPAVGLIVVAAALTLLARPGTSSYRV